MHQASYLLPMLLTLLSSRGLAAESLDPWRAWVVFKQFARVVDESPDPGVSVQLYRTSKDTTTLSFIRQVVEPEEDGWLEPVGGVCVDLAFDDTDRKESEVSLWSFDFGSFERFVDEVEQNPAIAERLVQSAVRAEVYWEEA